MLKTSLTLLLFVFIGFFTKPAWGTQINYPADCFDKKDFCSSAEEMSTGYGPRYIGVKFYARLANDFDSVEDMVEKFTTFHRWKKYTENSDTIDVTSSGLLHSTNDNGRRKLTQYARYFIKAPWPVSQIEVVERTTFRERTKGSGYALYWTMHSDRDFAHMGIKRKDGTLRVVYDEAKDVYYVGINLEIVPTTSMLKAAKKPILRAMADLFVGMFDIE